MPGFTNMTQLLSGLQTLFHFMWLETAVILFRSHLRLGKVPEQWKDH